MALRAPRDFDYETVQFYNQNVNAVATSWGPVLLICLTVILGMVYNNSRINDLRSHLDKRVDDLNKRFDDFNKWFDDFNKRFDDLRDFVKSEIRRLEDRLSPIRRA